MRQTHFARRRTALAAMSGIIVGILCAGAFPAFAEDIKIGVIVPTTGGLAPLGIDMRNGYEQALKDAPTVKGEPIKLVVEDEQASAAIGLSKAQKLVLQDRVKIFSSAVRAAQPCSRSMRNCHGSASRC